MKSKIICNTEEYSPRFKIGKLYFSERTGTLVICNESTDSNFFKSTCLIEGDHSDRDNWAVGEICNTSNGSYFKPFKGKVELIGE